MQTTQDSHGPSISFIVTYHDEPLWMLRDCIDSILALPLAEEEREIVLVDDGSSVTPLNELTDHRDDLIYIRQKNAGLSMARNRGIEVSRGEYIQFVDADDALIVSGYTHCLDMLEKHHPDLIMFNFTREEGDVDTPYLFDGPFSGAEYMRHNNLRASACCYFFRRKILVGLRFTPDLLHEDEEFTPQLVLRAEDLYSTDTCAYFYRERQNSIVHTQDTRWQVKRLDDAEYVVFQLSHLADTLPAAERTALQRRVAQLTMDYVYNIIMQTRSEHQLDERLERLRKRGLFPLPDRDYTHKYSLFRRMVNTKVGRRVLLTTLPLIRREK